jgi:hypothetical protein
MSGLDLIAFLKQFTKYNIAPDGILTPKDYRNIEVTLRSRVTLATAAAPPNNESTYRVPTSHKLLVWAIRGMLAFNAPASESAAIGNLGQPDVRDRMALKAMNARLSFVNNDLSGEKFFDNKDLPLSSILEVVGGKPIEYPVVPGIVNPGQTIEMDVTFLDAATAAVIGGSTDYGIVLDACLLRVSES